MQITGANLLVASQLQAQKPVAAAPAFASALKPPGGDVGAQEFAPLHFKKPVPAAVQAPEAQAPKAQAPVGAVRTPAPAPSRPGQTIDIRV